MNIYKIFCRLLTLLAGVASLAMAPLAFAIDPSHLVQEGNTNCRDYGDNRTINGITVASPLFSATAESPAAAGDGDVTLKYWIEVDPVTSVQALKFKMVQDITVTPPTPEGVNIVILKGDGNKAETYTWGSNEGVSQWPPPAGTSVDLTVTEPQTSIESITFCYGLGLGEEVVITLPGCGNKDLASGTAGSHYDTCESTDGGTTYTSDFECDIVAGELECCSCYGPLEGCVLGDTGCQVNFSDFDGSWVGSGSPSRYCRPIGTSYICYYR
jgi:hypothetical protein